MIDEKNIDKADSILTKLKTLLRKHWGILTLLLLGYGVYRFCCAVSEEIDKDAQTPVQEEQYMPAGTTEPTYVDSSQYYQEQPQTETMSQEEYNQMYDTTHEQE